MKSSIFTWCDVPMTEEDLAHEATSKYGWDNGDHYFEELQDTILKELNSQPKVVAERIWAAGHNNYIYVKSGAPNWEKVLLACESVWRAD